MMNLQETRLYHGLTGNATPPIVTGWTRGAFVSATVGLINMAVLLLPLTAATAATIMTGLIPMTVLVAFVLFGYLDQKFSSYLGDGDANEG